MNDRNNIEMNFPSEIILALENLSKTFLNNDTQSKISQRLVEFKELLKKYPNIKSRLAGVRFTIKAKLDPFSNLEQIQTLYFNNFFTELVNSNIPTTQAGHCLLELVKALKKIKDKILSKQSNPSSTSASPIPVTFFNPQRPQPNYNENINATTQNYEDQLRELNPSFFWLGKIAGALDQECSEYEKIMKEFYAREIKPPHK